jgi:hypothetical protein
VPRLQTLHLGLLDSAFLLCVLAAVLLMRRSPWGYLLASVAVLKFVTMGLAVSLMAPNQVRVGVPISPVELAVFPVITLMNLALAVALLRSADGRRPARGPAVV